MRNQRRAWNAVVIQSVYFSSLSTSFVRGSPTMECVVREQRNVQCSYWNNNGFNKTIILSVTNSIKSQCNREKVFNCSDLHKIGVQRKLGWGYCFFLYIYILVSYITVTDYIYDLVGTFCLSLNYVNWIVGQTFCFLLAVLVLYFRYFLRWDDDLATSIYHAFVALCYLTPILGAIVADSWLGKFKTIIYLSIVYAIGQIVMAVSAIQDITDTNRDGTPDNMTVHVALAMIGLILIALGTGGIKPCVSAFGGDQFKDHQTRQRSTFFSVFYLCINAGSLLSTLITPILRGQECGIHSTQKCYPLAFGVPAALMVVSLVVFIAGSGMYVKAAPKGNIMLDVSKCIGFAVKNRFNHRSSKYPKREHWLDWADEKYDKLLIAQIKMVLKVLFLYIPLPMFWTLFDQKGSRWTLQATTMDGTFGTLVLQPDQMQTVNPILILTLVPIMDRIVYPLIRKCGFNFTPLKRMTVGMFLAAMAFVSAALVQIQIDKTLPVFPSSTQTQLKVVNMGSAQLQVNIPPNTIVQLGSLKASKDYMTFDSPNITVLLNTNPVINKAFTLSLGQRHTLIIPSDPNAMYLTEDLTAKPEQGNNAVRFVNGMRTALNVSNIALIEPSAVSNNTLVSQGSRKFTITDGMNSCQFSTQFGFGGAYTFLIPSTLIWNENCGNVVTVEDIQPNTVHMALQIPQYFLITAGEVVFSVTGLEFSYSQAPSNMKAVLQAGWLLTVAVGNIIVLIVAELAKLPEKWAEYVLFASLLVAVCIIFSIMAYFYTYIDPAEIEAKFKQNNEQEPDEKEAKESKALEMETHKTLQSQENEIKFTKI
ncbi:solute carrier family 15 member 1 isoform X2 [Ictalurus furcatus]|uniref:solute carrier family 15 member 1 isoform X2 n=1 Tax=Ictalurus furcatus TaxID=66913 RepID=UPI0023503B39|nr:solute carrier family 15 member 1 isoform X2 [Ictalurus furcatus]